MQAGTQPPAVDPRLGGLREPGWDADNPKLPAIRSRFTVLATAGSALPQGCLGAATFQGLSAENHEGPSTPGTAGGEAGGGRARQQGAAQGVMKAAAARPHPRK